ncbi:MAG: DUF2029 domain-containing protein [Clostridia bacterium]|nr:DUF2029 domain-containing protein [Clostridia bacterium]
MELGRSDGAKESLTVTFFKVLIFGWLIYFAAFLFAEHYVPGISLDFMLHDNYGNGTNDWFRDFFEVNRAAMWGNSYLEHGTYAGSCGNYPPLVLLIGKFFARFTPSIFLTLNYNELRLETDSFAQRWIYFLFAAIILACFSYVMGRYIRHNHGEISKDRFLPFSITAAVLLSYTMIFTFERGNYIYLAIISFLLFVVFYGKNDTVSAISLAICACVKVYPVFFFAIFLMDKKYKPLLIGGGVGLAGLLLPMLALNGTFTEKLFGFIQGVFNFNKNSQAVANTQIPFYMIEQHSNSFSNIFRALSFAVVGRQYHGGFDGFLSVMSVISKIFSILLTAVGVVSFLFHKSFWKRCGIVLCLIVLLPSNTFDYMLTFFLPLLVMVLCLGEAKDRKYVILMTLLACVPKGFAFFDYRLDSSIQTLLNPLILTTMMVLFLLDAVPEIKAFVHRFKGKKSRKRCAGCQ